MTYWRPWAGRTPTVPASSVPGADQRVSSHALNQRAWAVHLVGSCRGLRTAVRPRRRWARRRTASRELLPRARRRPRCPRCDQPALPGDPAGQRERKDLDSPGRPGLRRMGRRTLVPGPAGCAELLEQLKVRVRASAARAANSELLALY